ncbi:hypothetical protein C8Q74DRAFT_1449905 [Fomes fomentarius]|nr:hypothetical protein C8Q74DRAFT_1449905 [Fomes fomentarius]
MSAIPVNHLEASLAAAIANTSMSSLGVADIRNVPSSFGTLNSNSGMSGFHLQTTFGGPAPSSQTPPGQSVSRVGKNGRVKRHSKKASTTANSPPARASQLNPDEDVSELGDDTLSCEWRCGECDHLTTGKEMWDHVLNEHGEDLKEGADGYVKCLWLVCNKDYRKGSLKKHIETFHNRIRTKCTYCGFQQRQDMYLNDHGLAKDCPYRPRRQEPPLPYDNPQSPSSAPAVPSSSQQTSLFTTVSQTRRQLQPIRFSPYRVPGHEGKQRDGSVGERLPSISKSLRSGHRLLGQETAGVLPTDPLVTRNFQQGIALPQLPAQWMELVPPCGLTSAQDVARYGVPWYASSLSSPALANLGPAAGPSAVTQNPMYDVQQADVDPFTFQPSSTQPDAELEQFFLSVFSLQPPVQHMLDDAPAALMTTGLTLSAVPSILPPVQDPPATDASEFDMAGLAQLIEYLSQSNPQAESSSADEFDFSWALREDAFN